MSTADRAVNRALDRIHTEETENTRPYVPGSLVRGKFEDCESCDDGELWRWLRGSHDD